MSHYTFNPIPYMKNLILGCFLLAAFVSFSQEDKEANLSIVLLENDNITEVNIEQEKFIESLMKYAEYCKKSLADLSEKQRVAVLLVAHPSGAATYSVYSNPKDEALESRIEKDLGGMSLENTKLVDFPILLAVNCNSQEEAEDFEGYKNPVDERMKAYEAADLKTKAQLNKEYAIKEILPVLAAYEVKVDDQFAGVKNFGKLVQKTDFSQEQDVLAMTDSNNDYWRATLEMEVGNQLIPLTKIYMLVSQGEFDYAKRYLEILTMFSNPKTTGDRLLDNISQRLDSFYADMNIEMQFGMAEHDKGNYEKAMNIYEDILAAHPKSAWALYEHYYSDNTLKIQKKEIELGDQSNWEKARPEIYRHNPVYDVDVHLNTGKQAYLLMRRQEIQKLFQKQDQRLQDVFTYAEIATDLDAPGLAAQFFWLTATFDKDNTEKSINNFLYCLDKLGNTEIKTNFKGDYAKIFKKIDAQKEKEMKASPAYKMMAK